MIVDIPEEGQFLLDDSVIEQLSERNAELESAIERDDEAGFELYLAELLAWVRSKGKRERAVPGAADVLLPSKKTTMNDVRPAFASVVLYRRLAAADPDRYRLSPAYALSNLGDRLLALHQPGGDVWATEAVAVWRELAAADPDRFRSALAAALYKLGARFFAPGDPDAVPVFEEAVAVYRELAAANPDRYRPDLAAALYKLGARPSALGNSDAVPVLEEAVAVYRELAAASPHRYRPDLATALSDLGARLSALGNPDAVPVLEEASALYKALPAERVPEALSVRPLPRRRPSEDEAAHEPPPPQSVAYDYLVHNAFAELVQPGRLLFNPPSRMQLGATERVEVRLTRTLTLDAELLKYLRGRGEPHLEEISTSPLMAVTLKGDGFQITSYSDEEQGVSPDGVTMWEFDIRALKRGQQRLVIAVSLRVPVAGQPMERKSIPVREATIDVQVGAPALIGHFVAANWQWFVGTAIAIAAVLVALFH